MIRAVRAVFVALLAVLLAACSSNQSSTFAISGASVDPTHWCPGASTDAAYDVHGTVQVHNGTSSTVKIESVTATMTLAAVTGNWLEKVGDRYEADKVQFTPATAAPGATTRITFTFPSACTSAAYGAGTSSQGDYVVAVRLTTNAGAYSVTASNRHSIRAA